MTAPKDEVITVDYQNPDATGPLRIPVLVIRNTPDEKIRENIAINAARDLPWVSMAEPHDGIAVLVGGGPSVKGFKSLIAGIQKQHNGVIFAMNAASQWLRRECNILPDYQVIADAKPETSVLVDHHSDIDHLFASQVDPKTVDAAGSGFIHIWHLAEEGMEEVFPEVRVKHGGYVMVGGGAAVGNTACCLAYCMGFRELHLFGYDSCHEDGKSHAYDQPMNQFIPTTTVEWAGETFVSSLAMKAQAEKFQITGQQLKQLGCEISVYGHGLLQTMWETRPGDLNGREKYEYLWQYDSYRDHSPGEHCIPYYLQRFQPASPIIDFGCGTGRASLAIEEASGHPILVDFADNCRDQEAHHLPFVQWDLSKPCPLRAPSGFCSDVMEHIPPEQVDEVIHNILGSAQKVFFQISTVEDQFGALIAKPLHLSVHPHDWWAGTFQRLGYTVEWQEAGDLASCFFVSSKG